jgi:UDP-glucose 4-epimerase
MTQKIVITGGAGFLGFALAKRLLKDTTAQIILVDNFQRGQVDVEFKELCREERIQLVDGDLRDNLVLEPLGRDIGYIYHLAARVGVKNVSENPDQVLQENVESTINVVNFAKQCDNVRRLVFASTSEVYAGTLRQFGMEIPTPEQTPLTLEDISKPRTTYALSKMFGECLTMMSVYNKQLNCTVVRYHNIYGPRMGYAHVIPELIFRMRKDEVVEVFSPNHTRAFCYVDDAVTATIGVATSEKANGKIYNVGDSTREISMMDLAKLIQNQTKSRALLIEGAVTEGSPVRRCPNVDDLFRDIQFKCQVGLEEGISLTDAWYKDRLIERHE